MFTAEQLQQSPVISNISFTVQSSINGYTIQCGDFNTMTTEDLTINITGIEVTMTQFTIHLFLYQIINYNDYTVPQIITIIIKVFKSISHVIIILIQIIIIILF